VGLFIAWDDRYSVGVRSIDRQHRFLISIIRQLQEAMVEGRAREVLSLLARKLVMYTHKHFESEEAFFRERGYAGAERHREQHREMARQIMEMQQAVKDGKLRIGTPVLVFLKGWLVDHVLGEDQIAFREIEVLAKASRESGGGSGNGELIASGGR